MTGTVKRQDVRLVDEQEPFVSVVIPTRNRRPYLRRTLAAVLAQRGVRIEVVVVDEASDDDTQDFLQQLEDARVKVVRHERALGVAAARNSGITHAGGDWLAFTDDDDLWAPDKLSAQLVALKACSGASWSCVGAVVVNESLRVIRLTNPPREIDVGNLVLDRNIIPGGASGVLATRELVAAVGGFDTHLTNLADWDYWIRLALNSPLASVHRPLMAYVIHAGSLSHNVGATQTDLDYILRKYADERRERGIALSGLVRAQYFAEMHQRAGRRLPAVLAHMKVARHFGDRKSWAWALLAGLSPHTQLIRDYGSARRVPRVCKEEIEQWLGPIRRKTGGGERLGGGVVQSS